jgi:competence protein ComEA
MNGLNKFTPKEERMLLSLAIVVFIGIGLFYVVNKFDRPDVYKFEQVEKINKKQEIDYRKNKTSVYDIDKIEKPTKEIAKFKFNPNIVSKDSLLLLGVDERTASNLIKYREKGGKIKTAEKFFKIYGMEQYRDQLASFIEMEEVVLVNNSTDKLDTSSVASSKQSTSESNISTNSQVVENRFNDKVNGANLENKPYDKPLRMVEVNSADSLQLQTVRGIKRYTATQIMRYRDRLGGFYNIHQLEEINGLRPELFLMFKDQLKIDVDNIKKIKINSANAIQLGSHPYIGQKFGNITILYRNNHGPFKSMADVAKVKVFDQETLDRIKYYISFD